MWFSALKCQLFNVRRPIYYYVMCVTKKFVNNQSWKYNFIFNNSYIIQILYHIVSVTVAEH